MNPSVPPHSHSADAWLRALVQERTTARWENDATLSPLPQHLISTPESAQKHLNAILTNARQNGLFAAPAAPPETPPVNSVATHASNQHWFRLVASVAILGIGILLLIPQHTTQDSSALQADSTIILRGDEMPQHVIVPANETPTARADRIEAVLKRHHVKYRRTPAGGGKIQIQALLPEDAPARADLHPLGVEAPEHERLDVIISATPF